MAGGVGLVLAGDFVGGFVAVLVGHGDGKAEGDLGQVMGGGVDDDGGLEPRLQPAEVAFGGGFGKLVETVGAGLQRGEVGLALGDLRVQGGKAARGDDVGAGRDGQFRQVGAAPGILVDEGAAHFRITSSGS
jgi:hypothetical protein